MTRADFIVRWLDALGEPSEGIGPDTPLASISAWDSMGMVATVGFIDTELKMRLPPGTLQRCVRVADLVDSVQGKLSE